jgi:hypothetical protein
MRTHRRPRTIAPGVSIALAGGILTLTACAVDATEDQSTSQEGVTSCAFVVTRNTYTGSANEGIITFVNEASSAMSGLAVSLQVPSGVRCHHAQYDWAGVQVGTTCTYSAPSTLSVGAHAAATLTFYTSSGLSFTPSNVEVTSTSCPATPPSGSSSGSSSSGSSSSGSSSSGSSSSGSSSSGSSSSGSTSGSSSGAPPVPVSGSSSGAPAPGPQGPLDPKVAPGGNFDLSTWELQLPIGSGSPLVIPGSQLSGPSGFTDIYFHTDGTDGAMTFMDPTTGTTTSGSLHPRSELREVTSGWSASGTNVQTVTAEVVQVPDHVSIGQIFQASPAPSKPLMELQYKKGGTLVVLLENTNQGGSATFTQVGSVPDGSKFTYQLSLTGQTLSVAINGKVTPFTVPPSFAGESFYFKCGDYDQTAVSGTPGTTPGTLVKVYALSVVHR